MAKNKGDKGTGAASPTTLEGVKTSSAGLVTELAALDGRIIALLHKRAELALRAASKGGAEGVVDVARDEARLEQLVARHPGSLPEGTVRAVLRELYSGCRWLVRRERIAFLGPLYSFSHLAALHHFGQTMECVAVGSIPAVFEEVHQRHSQYGLVPLENSTDGRVADTLDMFTRLPLRITGEVEMRIHHALLGRCPRSEVLEVYSRPQALSQCRNWLAKHLPGARTIEVTSTSTAAQLARDKPGAAAIASREAGIHYGLEVLAEQIEDNPGNSTRFAIIGGASPKRTGRDLTAMMFQVPHRPGALAEAMNVFKRNQVNLTWIESFPIPGSDRAYMFFVEMEGHQNDARLRRAVRGLQRRTLRLEILGSFPAPQVID
jgi:chorismate mutase/prephenate dehydratase